MKKSEQTFSLTFGRTGSDDWRDTWQVFKIMAEFVSGYEFLSTLEKEVTVFGSARTKPRSKYYRETVKLGKLLGQSGYTTMTGGGPGIMEAANKGAAQAGGESVGINIQLPQEQRINPYVKKSEAFNYFFVRKVILSAPAHSFVFLPGGFGTLDELFEILDSMELKLINRVPVILLGREFWQPLLDFLEHNVVEKFHSLQKRNLKLVTIVNSAAQAFKLINRAKVSHQSAGRLSHYYRSEKINWRIFRIMSEIVAGLEFLAGIKNNVTVLGTKSIKPDSSYYATAYELGQRLAKKKFSVVTGGGSGIMEAANKGAQEVRGTSIGLYTHTIDQGPVNKYMTKSMAFEFPYTRKLILTAPSKAFMLFPGGFGTLDQCFEVLTLIQTGKMKQVPVILFGREFWQPLLDFLEHNVFEINHAVARFELKLFTVVDTVAEAMKVLDAVTKKNSKKSQRGK